MREWYRDLVKNVVKDGVGVIKTDFSEALPVTSVFYDGSNGQQGHNKNRYCMPKQFMKPCRK